MIRGLFGAVGKLAFLAATMAFLTAVSLFLLGSFVLTFPIMRKSPRDRRLKATVDLTAATLTALQAWSSRQDEQREIDA